MKNSSQVQSTENITSVMDEKRVFQPNKEFTKNANIKSMAQYKKMYKESILNPEKFWGDVAGELHWFKYWTKVKQWNPPNAKWYLGGKTNLSYNCLDRHLTTWRRNKAAIIWEGEPGETRILTYQVMFREVCKFANVLKQLGVGKGDCVAVYMGMVPELAIAILACTRIGAVHTVVFGGFSSEALKDRINDAQAKLVITQDAALRRGSLVYLKPAVDKAIEGTPSVENVVVFRRIPDSNISMSPGRDHWWHEIMQSVNDQNEAEHLDSEHPLFILYTSGTTGKPKGILHTTAGYMVNAYLTSKMVFDLKDEDIFWCTADIGWVTGHTYVVYGPMLNGATSVMYEGAPNHPEPDRFWRIIDKYKINIFYTAPTAIRAFMRWGEQWVLKHNLSSLRLLGTVGEPINPEAWMWYHKIIGKAKCPIVDTWWQTETGTIMISPLPGITPTKPGSCTLPMFGVLPEVVDRKGKPVPPGSGGFLIIKDTWPSMLRTIYGDKQRFKKQYFGDYKGYYFTGDGARKDSDGYFWVMGRVDDVINVAGHRLGTAEIESALVSHRDVAEAAVVARPDEIKGSAIVAFVTLENTKVPSLLLKEELRNHVAQEIGHIAKPDEIRFSDGLPKTRSGKIMRRLLREIATSGTVVGDTTTLEDFGVLEQLRSDEE
ncbi:MAG: acetate--CoA ligase [Ignavibacteria bacterium CG22_combo_CG10-13_8_21_14_all_37_15]|nr:MAG: acetate--CoA ligase [Ignavibacteria bacterium CG22_combo_CG10-13_8_21_14_all_37_15]PJC58003.1 MAG: acetate--CoA ligase [Ignavibacteria bacterium CG_4_9_14_0_2_um_filter_37_13]